MSYLIFAPATILSFLHYQATSSNPLRFRDRWSGHQWGNFAAVAFFSISGQIHQGTNRLNGVTVSVGTNTVTTSNGTYAVATYGLEFTRSLQRWDAIGFSPSNAVIVVGPKYEHR